jgi:hypothetical protein
MLLGIYKNIEELEDNLSLEELEAILIAKHDQEHEQRVFAAALKGVDLEEASNDAVSEMELYRAKADAIREGRSAEEAEFDFFGIELEVE